MSDASKAHKLKLANSRKRFKELQELKKKNAAKPLLDTTNNEVTEQTTESLTSSVNVETPLENANIINTQLPTYFTTADYEDGSIFFDNLQKNDIFFNNSQSNNIDCIVPSLSTGDNSKLEFPSIVDQNHSLINQEQIGHNADSQVSEDSDIRSNELFEHQRNLENNLFSEKNKQNLIDYIQGEQQVSHTETTTNLSEIHNSNLSNADSYYVNKVACLIPHEYNDSNSITDLEKRNIELTSYLEQEKNNSIHYKTRINELETQIFQLENQNQLKDKHLSEINKLKEDLNCHSQTIRLLVAEKAELSNGLSQLEINLKTKNSECSELQARLKASRSRAFEFEQELNGLKLEKIHKETNNHDQDKIIENLRRDFDNLQDKNEELKQDLLEVTEKLKSSTEENTNLLKSNSELYSKLSLADIKIQQLTNASHQPTGVQVDQLAQEKIKLEKEVETVNNILKSITKERDESTVHYQKYTEELNYQLATLQEQYQQLQQENDTLSIQEQNRVKHISDLERQLQSIQNERVTFSANLTDCNLKSEFEVTKELCVQLQMEKTELDENYTKTLNEKDMLLKELVAKNDSLSQLESLVEQLRGNQPDSVKLLATMESDKVAAARAVQQNRELKEQLESMTEVFTKMDNDKVELTDRLTVEQSSNRDLLDKLQKTELQLQRLTDAIEIKDRELSHLRETSLELNKQIMQQEQLTDRLRHYEAHNNSSHFLQNELQEAKQTIVRLSNELNNQRNQGTNSELQGSETITVTEDVINLGKQLEELKLRNQELKTKLINHSSDNINTENLSEFDDSDNLLKKEEAMKHLEEKVKRTMQDIADLTEEKQRLEHLVLQLQGETETIGEYVALYQHQRMVLKQKAVEKDEQLKQLASDREQIKTKLEKLNKLVEKIFQEKVLINSEVVNQYENIHVGHKTLENVEELNDTKSDMQAKEILALLSEIKSSNLVEPKESVHHCPFCSGQLITV